MNKYQKSLFLIFIAVSGIMYFAVHHIKIQLPKLQKSSDSGRTEIEESWIFPSKKLKFNHCFKAAALTHYEDTDKFFVDLSACLRRHFKIPESQMDYFKNYVGSERKVFLSMTEEYRETECRWLTIGIGGSTAAEEALRKKYPNCVIYGVEPPNYKKLDNPKNDKENDEFVLSVNAEQNGTTEHARKTLSLVTFTKILDEFISSRFLHYLAIDIVGGHKFLAELIGNGKFANENITFCQIDVELHNPKQGTINPLASKLNRVQWMLDFLADSSPYIPIFTKPYQPAHKVTFVNFVHPECERAFKIKNRLEGRN